MKKILVVMFMAAAWAGGYGYGRWYAKPAAGEKKPLYWVDPMHPWYKSEVPGIAPDCNMKLVPVYPRRRGALRAAGQQTARGQRTDHAGEAATDRRGIRHGGIRNGEEFRAGGGAGGAG